MKSAARYVLVFLVALALVLTGCTLLPDLAEKEKIEEPRETVEEKVSTGETKEPVEENFKEPYLVSSASIGVTGDILIHKTVYKGAQRPDGVYDFTENYEHITPYFEKYDYMVANLEVTLGGENPAFGTYPSTFPYFNSPDSVVDALKNAGVDMLLTANNHSYDTHTAGLLRTVSVVREKGLDYLGTRDNTEESFYKVKDVGGVKVGMANFTYASVSDSGAKALNGNLLEKSAWDLVSTFDPERLADFYAEAEKALSEMEKAGAEATVFYFHWGHEYQYVPTPYQKQMAKKLCEMGVDVIVGGHPHVIQPFETVIGENGNETLCIYSTGNAISNQRKFLMDSDNYSGHTEDGMIFGFSFDKYSDGSVTVSSVDILPTWTIREKREGRYVFQIIPLDLAVSDWKSFRLTDGTVGEAKASYNRTMELVGEGLNAAREKRGLEAKVLHIS